MALDETCVVIARYDVQLYMTTFKRHSAYGNMADTQMFPWRYEHLFADVEAPIKMRRGDFDALLAMEHARLAMEGA